MTNGMMRPRRRVLAVNLPTAALHKLLHLRENLEIVNVTYDPETSTVCVFVSGESLEPTPEGYSVRRVRLSELVASELGMIL